jgi:hypothetical protein
MPNTWLKLRFNRNAVASISPALTDEGGLRWVTNQNKINPEGVEPISGEIAINKV